MARRLTKIQFGRKLEDLRRAIEAGRSSFADDSPAKKKARIERGLSDPDYFYHTYLPHWFDSPSAEFHLILDEAAGRERHLAVKVPRDHAKSTRMSFGHPIRRICYALDRFIIIVAANEGNATDFTADIREELRTNEKIKGDFGQLYKTEGGDGDFVTANDIRVKALGRGQKIRGLKHKHWRPSLVIIDDAEDDESVLSEKERDKTDKWLRRAVMNSVDKAGQIIWLGTPLHKQSQLERLTSIPSDPNVPPEFPSFKKLCFQAWQDDERTQPLWPARYSAADLRQKETDIGSIAFGQEFMCLPPGDDTQFFPAEFFHYYENLPEVMCEIYEACDPSLGKSDRSDRSAIIDGQLDPKNRIYIIEADIKRRRPQELARDIIEHYKRNLMMATQVIEDDGYQELLRVEIERVAREEKIYLPIQGISHEGIPKEIRIKRLSAPIQRGDILFHRSQTVLINELIAWSPGVKSDDGADALEMLTRAIGIRAAFHPAYRTVQERRMKGGESGGREKFSMRPKDRTASKEKIRGF